MLICFRLFAKVVLDGILTKLAYETFKQNIVIIA
jgi:hypothetical protein